MGLTKYSLGQLLDRNTETNIDLEFGISDVRGVLNSKGISNTKVNVEDRDLSKFLVVRPGGFIFNHRVHDKLGLGYNTTDETFIFTNDYVAFYVKPEIAHTVLLPDYLYMWFLRNEFDRYMLFQTYGSATLFFSWNNMIELEINLPPLPIQQKYVAIYKALVTNQQSYERGLEDLKLSFGAILDQIKKKAPHRTVGELLQEIDERNISGSITNVQGINITKQFMPSVADTNGVNLKNYKVVRTGQFAYSGMQTGRDECIRIAYYTGKEPIIISPAYTVFIANDSIVLPEFIMMWFSREQSDRRGWFMSDSSIRTNLDLERFYEIEVPLPDFATQRSIVELYTAYTTRREISEKLKTQIRDICPILIKGSLEEAVGREVLPI